MMEITALEKQVDADHRARIEGGGLGAVVQSIEPGSRWDGGAARRGIATPPTQVQVGHRLRAEPEDRESRPAVDHHYPDIEVLPIDLRHVDAALHARSLTQQKGEDRLQLL